MIAVGLELPSRARWRELRIPDARNAYDPGSRLASPATYGAGGNTVPLTGGWGSEDPGDWPHWTFDVRDVFGRDPQAADLAHNQYSFLVLETTPAGLSSDTAILVGPSLATAEDINTAGGYAVLGGIQYTGGTRSTRITYVAAGAYSATYSGNGAANASIRGSLMHSLRFGNGSTGGGGPWWPLHFVNGLDSGGGFLSVGVMHYLSNYFGKDPLITLAAGRRSAVAGAETPVFRAFVGVTPLEIG